jgi:hypothetical protein
LDAGADLNVYDDVKPLLTIIFLLTSVVMPSFSLKWGLTALQWAACLGHEEIKALLLERGAKFPIGMENVVCFFFLI